MRKCKHGAILFGKKRLSCEREVIADQLNCRKCGASFLAEPLRSDEVRISSPLCGSCKPAAPEIRRITTACRRILIN